VKKTSEQPRVPHPGPGRAADPGARAVHRRYASAAGSGSRLPRSGVTLDNLLAEGMIETRTARTYGNRGRGRPAKVFVSTDAGRSAFEHAYDDLASNALRSWPRRRGRTRSPSSPAGRSPTWSAGTRRRWPAANCPAGSRRWPRHCPPTATPRRPARRPPSAALLQYDAELRAIGIKLSPSKDPLRRQERARSTAHKTPRSAR